VLIGVGTVGPSDICAQVVRRHLELLCCDFRQSLQLALFAELFVFKVHPIFDVFRSALRPTDDNDRLLT
jgi:hypothetical protein